VKFDHLTTPARVTYAIEAYAVDTTTARTALATDVDHHRLERWGALLAASFLEGYGQAVRASHTITTVGPLGNIVSVPQDDLDHADLVREAVGTVGQRLATVVGEQFQRPNTITVASGTGISVLIVAPVAPDREPATAGGTVPPRIAASPPAGAAPRPETPVEAGRFPTVVTPSTARPWPVAATE
jgi:intracellular multiplication protein IcmE